MKETSSYAFRVVNNTLVVEFINSDTDEVLDYHVGSIQHLGGNEDGLSLIVLHLEEKSWSSLPLLYDLASQIQKYCPNNGINWIKTFTAVELKKEAEKYMEENFKPSHTPPLLLEEGYLSAADAGQQALMVIEYMQSVPEDKREETRSTVAQKLKEKRII